MSLAVPCSFARLCGAWATVIVVAATMATAGQPTSRGQADVTAEFSRRVADYWALHRRMAGETGPVDHTMTPQHVHAREVALGRLIRQARGDAVRGAIFAPEMERQIVGTIDEVERAQAGTVPHAAGRDRDETANFAATVNLVYPVGHPIESMPAALLRALPALPDGLEYRFVRRALVLRDIEANLIVDFIPSARP